MMLNCCNLPELTEHVSHKFQGLLAPILQLPSIWLCNEGLSEGLPGVWQLVAHTYRQKPLVLHTHNI